jgi:membrane protein implicated in regulation of membrane protease activity
MTEKYLRGLVELVLVLVLVLVAVGAVAPDDRYKYSFFFFFVCSLLFVVFWKNRNSKNEKN